MKQAATTARRLIRRAARRFEAAGLHYGHGTREPLDEAVFLVLRGLGLPFGCPEADLDRPLGSDVGRRIGDLIEARIATRKPAAFLLNEAYFAGLTFYVDERVLIPRSPIAELIEQHFAPWVQEQKVRAILDLCTGSGCIAIACALAFPDAMVDATDISADALEVASINVARHAVGDRVRLIQSDLFQALGERRYEVIVSNPPYVPADEIAKLPAEYWHEPKQALAAGEDGLAIVKRLLQKAGRFLGDYGILVVEVGDREQVLSKCFSNVPFTWLQFERGKGADGVFLLEAHQVRRFFAQ